MKVAILLSFCSVILLLRESESCSIQLPETMLTKENFDKKIVGKVMTYRYMVTERYIFEFPLQVKMHIIKADGNKNIYHSFALERNPNDFTNGSCDDVSVAHLTVDDDTYALLRNNRYPGIYTYISSYPENYLITYACEKHDHVHQCCDGRYNITIAVANDNPDGFSWTDVDKDLQESLNLKIRDPKLKFVRKLLECPNDPPTDWKLFS